MPAAPITTLEQAQALERACERRLTPCDGGQVVWRLWGPPGGPPVLLLHGGSGSWNHWVRNIQALVEAGHRVLVPDLPGFGESDRPTGARDADGLLPALEAGAARLLGSAALPVVGFSFGGLTAGLWAQAHPARFAGLVLVGAPALSAERLPPLPLRAWSAQADGPARDAVHRHNLRVLMLAQDASVDALAVALHGANVPRDRLRRRTLMLTDALARLLPGLRCPVAGIWGEHDVLYRDGRMALVQQVLCTAPGFCGLERVPGAGHWVAYEAAPAFDRALVSLLQRLVR